MIDTISGTLRHVRLDIRRLRLLIPLAVTLAVAGCSMRSAPAVILFGAYFPDWLVFAILAVLVAISARILLGLAGLAQSTAFPLFTCLAIGILVAGAIDLLWLGR